MQRVRKAVIPAAGKGTRFLPATKSMPKEMLPIVDKPVVQYVVEEAIDSGIEDILVITGRGKRALEDHFDFHPELESFLAQASKERLVPQVRSIGERARIHYIRQKEQRGLGDAVALARWHVGAEPFAVLLGDTIIRTAEGAPPGLAQLMEVHADVQASIVGVERVPPGRLSHYGIVEGAPGGPRAGVLRLRRLVEKPTPVEAPSDLAIAGRYIFTPAIFGCLDRIGAGVGGEVQLTDAMNLLAREEALWALCWQAERFDIGDRVEYARCFLEFALRRPDTGPPLAAYLAARGR